MIFFAGYLLLEVPESFREDRARLEARSSTTHVEQPCSADRGVACANPLQDVDANSSTRLLQLSCLLLGVFVQALMVSGISAIKPAAVFFTLFGASTLFFWYLQPDVPLAEIVSANVVFGGVFYVASVSLAGRNKFAQYLTEIGLLRLAMICWYAYTILLRDWLPYPWNLAWLVPTVFLLWDLFSPAKHNRMTRILYVTWYLVTCLLFLVVSFLLSPLTNFANTMGEGELFSYVDSFLSGILLFHLLASSIVCIYLLPHVFDDRAAFESNPVLNHLKAQASTGAVLANMVVMGMVLLANAYLEIIPHVTFSMAAAALVLEKMGEPMGPDAYPDTFRPHD